MGGMSYAEETPSSGNKTLLIVVGVVGGVLIVALLICAGVVYLMVNAARQAAQAMKPMMEMMQDIQKAPGVADAFLADIRAGRLDAAYRSTTEAFKKRMSEKEFTELIEKHPAFKESAELVNMDTNQAGKQAQPFPSTYRFRYTAASKDDKNRIEFTVTVDKENEQLKVDQLQVFQAVNP
jgi:hypothetical protein